MDQTYDDVPNGARAESSNLPVPQPRQSLAASPGGHAPSALERFATQLFDALDDFADRVASTLGIR